MNTGTIYNKFNKSIVTIITSITDKKYAYGSGFFIKSEGYIVTSAHTCIDAKTVSVLYNESLHKAKIIGIDKRTDIAVLKIKDSGDITSLSFNKKIEIQTGEECYILGNHADSSTCICHIGHIKFPKYIIHEVFESIVVDVNVNKGTSGSPILNKEGYVIGMINWFMDRDCSGGVTGIFIEEICDNIINDKIIKSHIGFDTKPLKLQDILHYNINMAKKNVKGEIISSDLEHSCLKKNDIINEVNGIPVGILHTKIESIVYNMKIDDLVEVKYFKFSPENGMSWTTHELSTLINLKDFPEQQDKPVVGISKIKLN